MAKTTVTLPIEDYAVIGNCETLALVGRNGSIDWLGFPRFDSAACFAALLGNPENGRWLLAPTDATRSITRRYRPGTLILETTFETASGSVCLIDFMSRRDGASDLVRIVRGIAGTVAMHTDTVVRFEMGSVTPWVSKLPDGRQCFTAGPDRLLLETPIALRGKDMRTVGEFHVGAGDEVSFTLTWTPSFEREPASLPAARTLAEVESAWSIWANSIHAQGTWADAVERSLLTLKALSHWRTGGIVAAGTMSLPEKLGGARNWDYRHCWLRDATFTLYALMEAGSLEEARSWRNWLIRAVAGNPEKLQIMYGVAGERRLDEYQVPWLAGYADSKPVRVGNAAAGQVQLDVYGEVLDALYAARKLGLPGSDSSWSLECALIEHLATIWSQPDDGIWEVRGGRRHFTHSKVMAWVAFDRAIRSAEEFSLKAPLKRWRATRARIHANVCRHGFDTKLGTFVQSYGAQALDASLLLIALVGFLPPQDPRIRSTVEAVERKLLREGLVMRYDSHSGTDGLPPGEGAFLACSFWLVDNYVLLGRDSDARALFERLLSLRNDVGLLAEEYDPTAGRQLGNFPQAFSHLALINSARNLTSRGGPAHMRSSKRETAG